MDTWESNVAVTAVTAHVYDLGGPKRCSCAKRKQRNTPPRGQTTVRHVVYPKSTVFATNVHRGQPGVPTAVGV